MAQTQAILVEDFLANEEQDTFLHILHHDNRNGKIIRMEKYADKNLRHKASRNYKDLVSSDRNADTYVSLNSFRKDRRINKDVYNYENIAVDLDMHTGGDVEKLYEVLLEKIENKKLPTPTMITFTGRGLCVFYNFKRSIPRKSKSAFSLLEITTDFLFRAYENELAGCNCVVDKSVSDAARVIRLPGTVNQKNDKFCRLMGVYKDSDDIHSINLRDLADELGFEKKEEPTEEEKKTKKKDKKNKNRSKNCLSSRLRKFEILVYMRNAAGVDEGYRENLLFVAYSTAKPLLGREKAIEYVYTLNEKFRCPLSMHEVDMIFDSTDQVININGVKGYYVFTDDKLIDKLFITKEENTKLGFSHQGKVLLRDAKKEENRIKRLRRNDRIIFLLNKGCAISEVAKETGVSASTVRRVAKESEDLKVIPFDKACTKVKEKKDKRDDMIRYFREQGYSYNVISELTGCSLSTVKRVLSRGAENCANITKTDEESCANVTRSKCVSKSAYVGVVMRNASASDRAEPELLDLDPWTRILEADLDTMMSSHHMVITTTGNTSADTKARGNTSTDTRVRDNAPLAATARDNASTDATATDNATLDTTVRDDTTLGTLPSGAERAEVFPVSPQVCRNAPLRYIGVSMEKVTRLGKVSGTSSSPLGVVLPFRTHSQKPPSS